MSGQRIQAEKILQPVQLFAAFLVALLVVESGVLTAASFIKVPNWAPGLLVIWSIIVIPLFLFSPVLILKLVRPELLENRQWMEWQKRIQEVTSRKVEVDFGRVKPLESSIIQKQNVESLINQLESIDRSQPVLLTLELDKNAGKEGASHHFEIEALQAYVDRSAELNSFKGVALLDSSKKIKSYFPRAVATALIRYPSVYQLTEFLNRADFEAIKQLPGVETEFLAEGTSNVDALSELTEKKLDSMVVQGRGKIRGVVDRQDLVAKIVLAMAESGNV